MFARLFSRKRNALEASEDGLYAAIVAAARQNTFYADWNVGDTPLGRFEMLALHMMLILRRLDGSGPEAKVLAQGLTDIFFQDVDHSLRELGIGDKGVPRRMKTLSQMFFGRAVAYGKALGDGSMPELVDALARNVWPEGRGDAGALARYMAATADVLASQSDPDLLAGRCHFPSASAIEATGETWS